MNACTAQNRSMHRFDAEYVCQLRTGRSETIEHFVAYFGVILARMLGKYGESRAYIDDIRQETLARVLNSLNHGRGLRTPESLGAYVISVARNVRREFFRSGAGISDLALAEDRICERAPDPERLMMNDDVRKRVQQTLDLLSPMDRYIILMALAEDRPREDICRALNVKAAYLPVLLHRAKARFRRVFASRCESRSGVPRYGTSLQGGMR
jgi:RNA polymerase sigma factor (sigma-70 family)